MCTTIVYVATLGHTEYRDTQCTMSEVYFAVCSLKTFTAVPIERHFQYEQSCKVERISSYLLYLFMLQYIQLLSIMDEPFNYLSVGTFSRSC